MINKFLFGVMIGAIVTALAAASVIALGITTIHGLVVIIFAGVVAGAASVVTGALQ